MNIDHNKIIKGLGGVNAVADLVGVKPPSVSGWRNQETDQFEIPPSRILQLANTCENRKIYTRKQLRPDDYWLIWPDLKAPKAAQEVAT